jgi:glycerophosphoryl diester phosphodiesterase
MQPRKITRIGKHGPIIVAHAGGAGKGIENNRESILRIVPFHPNAIEIDVRRSKDGVLFCRHGSVPFEIAFWQFSPYLPFTWIKKLFPEINTLQEIIEVLPSDIILLLDIKDTRITGNTLLPYKKFFSIIIDYNISHLKELREILGDQMVYVLAPKIFIKRAILNAGGIADVITTLFWQNNLRLITLAKRNKLSVQPVQFFIPRKYYADLVRHIGGFCIVYDYKHFLKYPPNSS